MRAGNYSFDGGGEEGGSAIPGSATPTPFLHPFKRRSSLDETGNVQIVPTTQPSLEEITTAKPVKQSSARASRLLFGGDGGAALATSNVGPVPSTSGPASIQFNRSATGSAVTGGIREGGHDGQGRPRRRGRYGVAPELVAVHGHKLIHHPELSRPQYATELEPCVEWRYSWAIAKSQMLRDAQRLDLEQRVASEHLRDFDFDFGSVAVPQPPALLARAGAAPLRTAATSSSESLNRVLRSIRVALSVFEKLADEHRVAVEAQRRAEIELQEKKRKAAEAEKRRKEQEAQKLAEELARQMEEASERRRKDEELKREETKRRKEAAEQARLARGALPDDVRTELVKTKFLQEFKSTEEYQLLTKTPDPMIKEFRLRVRKAVGGIPNRVAGTSRSLNQIFIDANNTLKLCEETRLPFDQTFADLAGNLATKAPEILEGCFGRNAMNLATRYFFICLSEVMVKNVSELGQHAYAKIWPFAWLMRIFYTKWGERFTATFDATLCGRSPWLIPQPEAKDSEVWENAGNEELEELCQRDSSLFALRVAILVCREDMPGLWTLASRTLNRVANYVTHPIVPFLLDALFEMGSYALIKWNELQFQKLARVCRQHHFTKLRELCADQSIWKGIRSPTVRLDISLQNILNGRVEEPAGKRLQREEAEIDPNL